MLFPWKPVDVQLGTISETTRIGDCYQWARFYACIKKCTICLKFRVMPPDYKIYLKTSVFKSLTRQLFFSEFLRPFVKSSNILTMNTTNSQKRGKCVIFKTSLFTPYAGHFVFNQKAKPFLSAQNPLLHSR